MHRKRNRAPPVRRSTPGEPSVRKTPKCWNNTHWCFVFTGRWAKKRMFLASYYKLEGKISGYHSTDCCHSDVYWTTDIPGSSQHWPVDLWPQWPACILYVSVLLFFPHSLLSDHPSVGRSPPTWPWSCWRLLPVKGRPCFFPSIRIKHLWDNQTKDRSRAIVITKEIHIYGPLEGDTPGFMVLWNLSVYKDNRCIQKQWTSPENGSP